MPGFEYGYRRAIYEIIGGIIALLILNTIISLGWLPVSWIFLFKFLNTLSLVILLLVMPYWGTTYLLGWLFGLMTLTKAGLVNTLEAVIYFGVPLIILIIRLIKNIEENTIISII